jgi:hypothetical protein
VYPAAHLTTPAITAENAMAMDQNKNGFMNRGKMKCLPILTLKNGLDFTRDNLGNSDSKMGHPQKYRPSNSKSWEFTSKNALEMKQCVLFCMFFYCKNQHFCLPI